MRTLLHLINHLPIADIRRTKDVPKTRVNRSFSGSSLMYRESNVEAEWYYLCGISYYHHLCIYVSTFSNYYTYVDSQYFYYFYVW